MKLLKNTELWNKLQKFNLDDPTSEFSLSQRLSRENGWSTNYSKRVIEEYKKFLYLSVIERKSLTPSDEVDQAWHLHMLYTESYWNDLCNEILGMKFHHGPTKGGTKETEKYLDQYNKTLALYQVTFGKKAPEDIWPSAEKRFSHTKFQRINLNENYVLNKSKVKEYMTVYVLTPLLVIIASLFMFATNIDWGKTFLLILIIIAAIFIIRGIYRYINRNNRGGGGSSSGGSSSSSGCSAMGSFFGCSGCSSGSSGCGSSCGSSCGSGCGGCGS